MIILIQCEQRVLSVLRENINRLYFHLFQKIWKYYRYYWF